MDNQTLRDQFALSRSASEYVAALKWQDPAAAAKTLGMVAPLPPDDEGIVLFWARVQVRLRYIFADAMMAERSREWGQNPIYSKRTK